MDDKKLFFKRVFKTLAKDARPKDSLGKCLSNIDFARFTENTCSGEEKDQFASHMLNCEDCKEVLLDYLDAMKLMREEKEAVAFSLSIKSGKEAVTEAIEKVKGAVKSLVYEFTVGRSPFSPVLTMYVDGSPQKTSKSFFCWQEPFGNYVANLEYRKRSDASFDLTISIAIRKTRKPTGDVRMILLKHDKKIKPSFFKLALQRFEKLEPGSYDLLFLKKSARPVGAVRIIFAANDRQAKN